MIQGCGPEIIHARPTVPQPRPDPYTLNVQQSTIVQYQLPLHKLIITYTSLHMRLLTYLTFPTETLGHVIFPQMPEIMLPQDQKKNSSAL